MKILFASRSFCADYIPRITAYVNKAGIHEARDMFWDPVRISYYRMPQDARKACEWADVIHCFHTTSPLDLGVLDLLQKRIWVFQWIGCYFRQSQMETLFQKEHLKYVRLAHLGEGLDDHPFYRQYKYAVLPSIVDIHDPIYRPGAFKTKDIQLGFWPVLSRREWPCLNDPDRIRIVINKGQAETLMALNGIRIETNSGPGEIEFKALMDLKRRCKLGIDCLVAPYQGQTTFEFMAAAAVPITYVTEHSARQTLEVTGASWSPIIPASLDTVRKQVEIFLALPEGAQEERCLKAREWVEKYYDPHIIWQRYLRLYQA